MSNSSLASLRLDLAELDSALTRLEVKLSKSKKNANPGEQSQDQRSLNVLEVTSNRPLAQLQFQ